MKYQTILTSNQPFPYRFVYNEEVLSPQISAQSPVARSVKVVYCTSDNQLLVMNFKLRLKKNLQQHRFIRLDLKAIPSEYSVELSTDLPQ